MTTDAPCTCELVGSLSSTPSSREGQGMRSKHTLSVWFVRVFFNHCFTIFVHVSETLTSVDYLSLYGSRFFWFFVCQVILDCILDILSTIFWDSGLCLNPTKNALRSTSMCIHCTRYSSHFIYFCPITTRKVGIISNIYSWETQGSVRLRHLSGSQSY